MKSAYETATEEVLKGRTLHKDEIFVKTLYYRGYYISQYGNMISMRNKEPRLLKLYDNNNGDGYYSYKLWDFDHEVEPRSMYVQVLVAQIFCEDYYPSCDSKQIHHMDFNRHNNCYKNLMILSTAAHLHFHTIKELAIFDGNDFTVFNLKEILDATGLLPDDIIFADRGKEPDSEIDGWKFFKIKDKNICYKYNKV